MRDAVTAAVERDPAASAARAALERAGGRVYAVGGALRDAALGNEPKDVDLLVAGLAPEEVERALAALPGRVELTGASFGVFRYRRRGAEVEVALPRTERSTGGRHVDFEVVVDPHLALERDLGRRDFTANAVALDLATGELLDPFGGLADIEAGILRTVSPRSFEDDPLRTLRALVAVARHGLAPDAATLEQLRGHAAGVRRLPGERIHAELRKLLAAPDPAPALRLALETGVLAETAEPLAAALAGPAERERALAAVAALPPDPELRLAALLHRAGAAGARELLRALRFPEASAARVAELVAGHGFAPFRDGRGARRLLRAARSAERARDLLRLRAAGIGGDPAQAAPMRELLERELAAEAPHRLRDLAVGGDDVLAAGVPRGPAVGRVLAALLERVVDDPSLNERETLLALARELAAGGRERPWV